MSRNSSASALSSQTQAILNTIALKNESKIYKIEDSAIDDKVQASVWEAFGAYVLKQLKHGKATTVPKFGIFTFTWPDGTTNEIDRNKEYRRPIFLISKDFVKGLDIKPGIFNEGSVNKMNHAAQTGRIPQVKLNISEIADSAKVSNDAAKICLERILRELALSITRGKSVNMEIPYVGSIYIRNNVAAVKFNENLEEDVKGSATRNLLSKTSAGFRSVSKFENLPTSPYRGEEDDVVSSYRSENKFKVDQTAHSWLKSKFNIDMRNIASTNTDNKLKFSTSHTGSFFSGRDSIPKSLYSSSSTGMLLQADSLRNKLLNWVRSLNIGAFYELAGGVHGYEIDRDDKLNLEDFQKALKSTNTHINKNQSETLFKLLDSNGDDYVDLKDWLVYFADEGKEENILKTTLKGLKSDTNGILKKLGIVWDGSGRLSKESLRQRFSRLCSNMSEERIEKVIDTLFAGREALQIADLQTTIAQNLDPTHSDKLLIDVKRKVVKSLKDESLQKKLMKELQIRSVGGRLESEVFRAILQSAIPSLDYNEATSFVNYLALGRQNIDIYSFAKSYMPSRSEEVSASALSRLIREHIKSSGLDTLEFLRKIYPQTSRSLSLSSDRSSLYIHKVPYSALSPIISTLLHGASQPEIARLIEMIDIDKDSYISKEDLDTFLFRLDFKKSEESQQSLTLFPTASFNENELQAVLGKLRIAMDRKHISNYELFRRLDENEDGFLTIDEFGKNLQTVLPLPQTIWEGFFAYMDKMHIGMIDYKSFLKVLQKSVVLKDVEVSNDSFDLVFAVLKEIRSYFEQRKVQKEDAFRIVDMDFDGNISKQDLKNFLTNVMRMSSNEANDPLIDRTFKLLDRYKRGYIQSEDFKAIFEDAAPPENSNRSLLSPSSSLKGLSVTSSPRNLNWSLDWKANARQQIGLVLSKKFPDISKAFEIISGHSNRITYKAFNKWIEDNHALHGFNLTESLLLQLFADFDPHKKGYLAYTDFENIFGQYNWDKQLLTEIQNIIYSNFEDVESAFEYFSKKSDRVTSSHVREEDFQASIKSLLPKRFSTTSIHQVWTQIVSGGRDAMSFNAFKEFLSENRFHKSSLPLMSSMYIYFFLENNAVNRSPRLKEQRTSSQAALIGTVRERVTKSLNMSLERGMNGLKSPKIAKPEASDTTFERLKQVIRSSARSIYELFKAADPSGSGKITSQEFKSVIYKLNVGLSGYEVSLLLDYCNTSADGYIDWMSFVDRIRFKEADARLFQRCKAKLKSIKENIYAFMLTPRDAFLQFSKPGSGVLTYEDFNTFITQLAKMSHSDIPAFSTIHDLFDFIDMKKDGVIDVNEWIQTFNQLTILEASTADSSIRSLSDFSKNFLKTQKSDWENTKNYDEVMMSIGRNRKLIYNKFCSLEQRKIPITYDVAKHVVGDVLADAKVPMEDKNWPILLKFAEQKGVINYKLLVDVYRNRVSQLACPPKPKTIYI